MINLQIADCSFIGLNNQMEDLGFKEKLEIAKNLSEMNFDIVEFPSVNDEKDEILIKTACSVLKKSTVAIYGGLTEESIEKNYKLVSLAKNNKIIISIPVSSIKMEYCFNKKPKAVLEILSSLTKKAVLLTKNVEVVLEDATRAELSVLSEAINISILNGVKTITLKDITGTLLPNDVCDFINAVKDACPDINKINLGVDFSDGLTFALSDYFTAIDCGALLLKVSSFKKEDSLGVGKLLKAFDVIGLSKKYNISLNKTVANRSLKRINEVCTNVKTSVFNNLNAETVELIDKDVKESELSSLIKKRGFSLNPEEIKCVYSEFKRLSEKKTVNTKELDVIIANVSLLVPETYSLVSFSVNSSNVLTSTASVVLKKDGKELSGISFGNGSIDSAFRAIENAIGRHFDLDTFEVDAVTEGKEAMGQTLIGLRYNGKLYSGRGVSTDIIGASIRAYITALNRIVFEENK